MIRAEVFTRAFDSAFGPWAEPLGFTRRRGRMSRWALARPDGALTLQFRVNPKISAIAGVPGEFWAELAWDGPRHGPRDDGTVSFFQYTTEAEHREIQALRCAAMAKAEAFDGFAHEAERLGRAPLLEAIRPGLDLPPLPNHPQHGLLYFDEADATAWGSWLGDRLGPWLARFAAQPETLEAWCWRVLWQDLPRAPGS